MKLKKLFLLTALVCGALVSASAQEEQDTTIYEFRPHWYIQGAFGYQYTIGESDAGTLSSPNAQIAFGYNFTPVWGLRFNINAWQSRDGYIPSQEIQDKLGDFKTKTGYDKLDWKWYYVAPAINVTMDLTNLFGGYKPKRIVNVGLFLGGGANIYFHNDEAWEAYDVMQGYYTYTDADGNTRGHGDDVLQLIWGPRKDGKALKASPLGQGGLYIDFRITDKFRLGLEGQGNILFDNYNSKKAVNPDWYINALVTAKYNFGGTYNERKEKKAQPCDQLAMKPDTVYIEKVDTLTFTNTEVVTVNEGGVGMMAGKEPLRVEIFFPISSNHVSITEYMKVKQIVNYMEENPDSKVEITGYADRATGTKEFNQKISEKRAQVVKDELINKYGISADRITAKAMGDTEQPHAEKGDDPLLNRVSICVVE